MDPEVIGGLNTTESLADYNLDKLALIASLTKSITNNVLQTIKSDALPDELNNTFDIFIVETIKARLSKGGDQ